jgi:hypothetical protein
VDDKFNSGETPMLTKTKIALATALLLSTVSATLATEDNDLGGFRIPGSMDGVNPVFHPSIAGKVGRAGQAYGYVASPVRQEDLSRHGLTPHDWQADE